MTTKSKRLSLSERSRIDAAINMITYYVYKEAVADTLASSELGDKVYAAIMAPYAPALAQLPAGALPTVDQLIVRFKDDESTAKYLSTSFKLSVPRPMFCKNASCPWFEISPYINGRIELSSIFFSAHPALAEEIFAAAREADESTLLQRRVADAMLLVVAKCKTSGQLLTMMPHIRDYLPEHLRDHTPTTRGVAAIKKALNEYSLPFDRIPGTFAAYKLMGK